MGEQGFPVVISAGYKTIDSWRYDEEGSWDDLGMESSGWQIDPLEESVEGEEARHPFAVLARKPRQVEAQDAVELRNLRESAAYHGRKWAEEGERRYGNRLMKIYGQLTDTATEQGAKMLPMRY